MNVSQWLDEIKAARKREKDFRKDGQEILDIYSNDKESPFNILYSNTETLSPALFSQVPRPVIQRRYKDEDPMGKAVSEAAQRMLEYLIDTDLEGYDNFESSIQDATLDALLPGRGFTSVKYESNIDSDDDKEMEWETVCTDSRKWDRVLFGFAHKWTKVPWIAYEDYLDEEEAKRLFPEMVKHLTFTEGEEKEEHEKDESKGDIDDKGHRETTLVYQIWDKKTKTIKYLSPQYKDGFLKEDDDPLGLTGFFNCPKPLQFIAKSNNLSPTAPYKLYENQAKELNSIQSRINRVITAIKVRGVYNGELGEEIEQLFKEEDNALIPTDKAVTLMEGGFDKNIWMIPIADLIVVAQQLMQARESCKRVIYEVTGISDIVRGQSMASETLGAQKIKEAWGTMRLKRLQKEVQRYSLDIMKIMLDIAVIKFSEKSWAKMTGLPFSSTQEKEQAEKLLEIARQNQVNPQDPSIAQATQVLQKPNWGDILDVLKDSFSRSYRIDMETNSTLDVEATEDKQLVGDFMNAMAQFMNGMGPLIEKGIMSFGAAKSMMLAIVKRYRFGREVEEELKSMTEPKPQENPEQEKALKQFQQEKQKFEEERKRAGEMLDQQAQQNAKDRMQLDFDKKLAQLELKHMSELKEAQGKMNAAEAQNDLRDIVANHKRDVQSMLDKHKANVDHSHSEEPHVPDVNITNVMPDGNKSIVIKREEGQIVGAEIA